MPEPRNFMECRKNALIPFKDDEVLIRDIPSIAARLINAEFQISSNDITQYPITFVTCWTEILKYIRSQQADEYSLEIAGCSIEYVTEYSESDKATNIVPQMRHKKTPIFIERKANQVIPGHQFTAELSNKVNVWRSVNLMETITSVENNTFSTVLNEYGIDLSVPGIIFPMLAAMYVAGIEIAKKEKKKVNMYNIFTISVMENDLIILTPLSTVKQWLKDDSKKF